MEIIISSNTSKPIYEQITSQFKAMIMSGELGAGAPIPSMRSLAKTIHVSVITVQKAYEDLTRDGFIETTVGRGSFVAEDGDQGRRRMAELTEGLHDTILELRQLGMTEQQWLDLWREEEEK